MALETYGLHELVWNLADQVVSDIFTASPMDARGRGIALSVRENGVSVDLSDASVYLAWTHRATGKRGTTPFEAVDASAGTFNVYYPAAMCGAGGIVDAAVTLSLGDGRYISTRGFLSHRRIVLDSLELTTSALGNGKCFGTCRIEAHAHLHKRRRDTTHGTLRQRFVALDAYLDVPRSQNAHEQACRRTRICAIDGPVA